MVIKKKREREEHSILDRGCIRDDGDLKRVKGRLRFIFLLLKVENDDVPSRLDLGENGGVNLVGGGALTSSSTVIFLLLDLIKRGG